MKEKIDKQSYFGFTQSKRIKTYYVRKIGQCYKINVNFV